MTGGFAQKISRSFHNTKDIDINNRLREKPSYLSRFYLGEEKYYAIGVTYQNA